MAKSESNIETEIKLRMTDAEVARGLLEQHRYRMIHPRVFESNTLYDTAGDSLRQRRELIRIRRAGERTVLTFKSADVSGRHKRREELETEAGDGSVLEAIFQRLGLTPKFRYEKYRTEYQQDSKGGIAMLDETPIGVFLELEGRPEWIDSAAIELGFAESAYILSSYGALYLDYCHRNGIEPTHMVFRAPE